MLQIIILTLFAAISSADIPVSPPVRCGEMPRDIYTCIGYPKVVKPDVTDKCTKTTNQCGRMTCIFRESGWMSGDAVDKAKLTAYFENFKKEYPEWSAAVDNIKASCTADLPTQGVYLNCPAYDVMFCALASFIKHVPAAMWSSDASCQYSKQYAENCPVCPNDCFALFIPNGSCNACTTFWAKIMPRTNPK